ncbi:MAG TPA: NAD(P)/FAD-dependent oxidoreductase, partial [Candidatus Krumholzibacterium sp.]|nr:NAD(P)/FAD-dependent oxidoreductase [Candidatus Krumholzibacterium sp.]
MTDERYDVVIIGGGPAGTRTASAVSGRGLSTLLLEKRVEIGLPVRCAEGVGPADAVERLIEPDDAWISSRVDGISIVSPDGRRYDKGIEGGGYVLDRHRFDSALARRAAENGAEIRTGHQATGLSLENGNVTGVTVLDLAGGRRYSVSSGLTVGADGVESLSPRWAGLRNASGPSSMFSCAQYLVEGIGLRSSFAEFHLGSRIAPGGYAWVFPKGDSSANVGVGIDPMRAGGTTAEGYLERFIGSRCPGAKRARFVAGGTLTGRSLPLLSTGGYLCVGEAANQNNPFTGGGILESLTAADIASEVIIEAFEAG